MSRYAIGLGSNLGDRLAHMTDACLVMEERLGPLDVSSIYETEPVGGPDQDPFLNAVAVVETELEPERVLDILQGIEAGQGRERSVHWGPRTLDLDIVAGPSTSTERLTIPHPRAREREFVLRPLSEVWPDAPVGDDLTASDALSSVGGQGVDLIATDWMPPVSRTRANILLGIQMVLLVLFGVVAIVTGSWPRTIGPWAIGGMVIASMGLVAVLWASSSLGSALVATPLPKEGASLVTTGPYRYVRHPIYGGLIVFLFGSALFLGSVLAFVVVAMLIILFLIKARYEEGHLRMRHAGYISYMEAVPHRLIPYAL